MSLTSILSSPLGYLVYQGVVGGIRGRRICIEEYVKPKAGMKVLDIGCGPAYTVDYFDSPEYYGFDVSQQYVDFANRKYASHGKFYCRLFEEDTLAWLPKMDVVLMMGLLHHLDDQQVVDVLSLSKRAMKPGARLFTFDGYYAPGQGKISRFFLDGDRGKFIREQAPYEGLAQSVFPAVKGHIRNDLFYIPYPILIMECMA